MPPKTHLCHLGYGECWTPLLLENVQTDIAIAVYIWMEHFGPEGNLQKIYLFYSTAKHQNIFVWQNDARL